MPFHVLVLIVPVSFVVLNSSPHYTNSLTPVKPLRVVGLIAVAQVAAWHSEVRMVLGVGNTWFWLLALPGIELQLWAHQQTFQSLHFLVNQGQ